MILNIIPEFNDKDILNSLPNVKLIDYKTFNTLEIHPFIATNNWEKINIVVNKGIMSGYIKQVLTKCNIISAIIPKDLVFDYEIVLRLIEIYPNISYELRSAYMKRQDIKEVLVKVGAQFE